VRITSHRQNGREGELHKGKVKAWELGRCVRNEAPPLLFIGKGSEAPRLNCHQNTLGCSLGPISKQHVEGQDEPTFRSIPWSVDLGGHVLARVFYRWLTCGPHDLFTVHGKFCGGLNSKWALGSIWCWRGSVWFVKCVSHGVGDIIDQGSPMWQPLISWSLFSLDQICMDSSHFLC
jgi:hypothetical protein